MCKWNVENYQGGEGRRSPDRTGYRWFWPLQGIHQSGVWRFTAVLTSGELKWMWHKNVCLQDVFLVSNIFCLFYSFQSSVSSFTPTPLPISLSPSSSDTKAGGKVKSSRSRAHYSQIGRAEGNIENEVCMTEISFWTLRCESSLIGGQKFPSFSFFFLQNLSVWSSFGSLCSSSCVMSCSILWHNEIPVLLCRCRKVSPSLML